MNIDIENAINSLNTLIQSDEIDEKQNLYLIKGYILGLELIVKT